MIAHFFWRFTDSGWFIDIEWWIIYNNKKAAFCWPHPEDMTARFRDHANHFLFLLPLTSKCAEFGKWPHFHWICCVYWAVSGISFNLCRLIEQIRLANIVELRWTTQLTLRNVWRPIANYRKTTTNRGFPFEKRRIEKDSRKRINKRHWLQQMRHSLENRYHPNHCVIIVIKCICWRVNTSVFHNKQQFHLHTRVFICRELMRRCRQPCSHVY